MSIISEARPYTLENIESEPDLPGVYEIINDTEDTLYVGSGILRADLLAELRSGRILGASHYRTETTATERDAYGRKMEEIWHMTSVCGRGPPLTAAPGPWPPSPPAAPDRAAGGAPGRCWCNFCPPPSIGIPPYGTCHAAARAQDAVRGAGPAVGIYGRSPTPSP